MSGVSSITPKNGSSVLTTQVGAITLTSTTGAINFDTPNASNVNMTWQNTGGVVAKIYDTAGNNIDGIVTAQGTNGLVAVVDSNAGTLNYDLSGNCGNIINFTAGVGIGSAGLVQIKPNTSPSAVEFLGCASLVVNSNAEYDIGRYNNDSIVYQQAGTGTSTPFLSIDKTATTSNISLSNVRFINGQAPGAGGVSSFVAAPNQGIVYSNITASNVNLFTDFTASNAPSVRIASSANSLTLGLNTTDNAGKVQSYLLTNQTDTQQWNSGTQYQAGALVEYSVQGRSPQIYVATTPSSNIIPIGGGWSNWNQLTTMLCVGSTSNPPISVQPQTATTSQSIILKAGSNITLTDNGSGTLTFDAIIPTPPTPPNQITFGIGSNSSNASIPIPFATASTTTIYSFNTGITTPGTYSGTIYANLNIGQYSGSNATDLFIGWGESAIGVPSSNLTFGTLNNGTLPVPVDNALYPGTKMWYIGRTGTGVGASYSNNFAVPFICRNTTPPSYLSVLTKEVGGTGSQYSANLLNITCSNVSISVNPTNIAPSSL
jgi:hypothetical protein